MIIKFTTWRHRTAVYRARKNNPNVGIRLDLTKKRVDILDTVRDLSKNNANIDFVFADVNCSLCFRLTNSKFVYFRTVEEAEKILERYAEDVEYDDDEDDGEDEGEDDGEGKEGEDTD